MKTRLVLILLCLLALYSCNGIDQETINQDDIIRIIILDANGIEISDAIGDGETIITLEAKIPSNADDDFQTVTFASSAGEFVGVGNTSSQVNVNEEGIARAFLKLPLDDGELFLSAQVGANSNLFKAESSITLMSVNEVIKLRFLDLSGAELNEIPRGDGTTIIQLEGSILVNQDQLSSIKFTSSTGTFQVTNQTEQQKNTDNEGKAIVNFIIPQSEGPVFFTATTISTPSYVDENNLVFERAYPDNLFVEPSSITMNTTDPNGIMVFLSRNTGHVSVGTSVNFEAFQILSGAETPVGRFTGLANAVTNSQEQITVNFYADTGDIDLSLPVKIRVSAINDNGVSIINETELDVN